MPDYVRAPDQPIQTTIYEADGLYIKQIVIRTQHMIIPQHSHVLSHITLLTNGSIKVWKDDEYDGKYDAPCAVFIAAGVKHRFETLSNYTVLYCTHSLAHPDALKVLAEHQIV